MSAGTVCALCGVPYGPGVLLSHPFEHGHRFAPVEPQPEDDDDELRDTPDWDESEGDFG